MRMSIIKELKGARLARDMKQSELGKKMGLPQSHISKIEQELTNPRLSTVADLARILDHELMLIPREFVPYIASLLSAKPQERKFQPDEEIES